MNFQQALVLAGQTQSAYGLALSQERDQLPAKLQRDLWPQLPLTKKRECHHSHSVNWTRLTLTPTLSL